jgi:hypothetical protein
MPHPYIPNKISKVRSKTHIPASNQISMSALTLPRAIPHPWRASSIEHRETKKKSQTYAVADFSNPHSCTGTPLNKIKPLPSRISLLTVAKKSASLGKGKNSYNTPRSQQTTSDHQPLSTSNKTHPTVKQSPPPKNSPSPSQSTLSHSAQTHPLLLPTPESHHH